MLNNYEGKQVPNVSFKTISGTTWNNVNSEDIFKDKNVIVFSLPGAFTPTCSSSHLPRFDELAPVFKAHGIDEIICVSVNDTFVMNAWSEDQDTQHIRFLPDGNGEFTEGMGMLVDKAELGFGKRSWRYSMLVKNGVVTKMFVEPNKPGDPFEVSDADTMLSYIAPNAVQKEKVTVFTKPGCPYCVKAKADLHAKGLSFEEIEVGTTLSMQGLSAISGRDTVPQVYIDGRHIGGSVELEAYLNA